MREAWFIVEVYCLLSVNHFLLNIRSSSREPVLLAILIGEFVLILLLSWLTFHGKRLASRLLAIYIAASALYFVWIHEVQVVGFDVYRAYLVLAQAYMFVGAIKLWRIKELPTRFTDPPAEPSAHS